MAEQKFKYYFGGVGYKNKRTLGRAIVESQLSDYGKQTLERLIQEGAENISSTQDMTYEEALKRVHVGFKSNDINIANTDLETVASHTLGDNYIYLISYSFVAGGAIIQLAQEKVTTKLVNSTNEVFSAMPVEQKDIDPNAPEYSPEQSEGDAYVGMGTVSTDFRVRD